MDETREYHKRYLRAVSNPLRIKILRAIKNGFLNIEDLKSRTGLDDCTLNWHLRVLEAGFCVEKDATEGKLVYTLTQEGRVIEHLKE
jgi:DNA-binding transcriptional ArsR family regulator